MIQHVHRIGLRSDAAEVWIATDDSRIEEAAKSFGANVCMTRPDHQSGTERLAEVSDLRSWPDDLVVVNLQGDEPLLPPVLVDQCAALLNDRRVDLATLASAIESVHDLQNPNIVKVILDNKDNALYFSRAAIPYSRELSSKLLTADTAMQHHGIYAYRCSVLRQLATAEPCAIEQSEKLEQLRALWLGMTLRVGRAAVRPGPGVDTEEDLAATELLLKASVEN